MAHRQLVMIANELERGGLRISLREQKRQVAHGVAQPRNPVRRKQQAVSRVFASVSLVRRHGGSPFVPGKSMVHAGAVGR